MRNNKCRDCGGKGKPSKGIMNFHNIRGGSPEFSIEIMDCLKCNECGHSWVPSTQK